MPGVFNFYTGISVQFPSVSFCVSKTAARIPLGGFRTQCVAQPAPAGRAGRKNPSAYALSAVDVADFKTGAVRNLFYFLSASSGRNPNSQ